MQQLSMNIDIFPLKTGILMTSFIQSFACDPHISISNISSIYSSNSEAFASELLEYLEELIPRYHMYSDKSSMFNLSNAQ